MHTASVKTHVRSVAIVGSSRVHLAALLRASTGGAPRAMPIYGPPGPLKGSFLTKMVGAPLGRGHKCMILDKETYMVWRIVDTYEKPEQNERLARRLIRNLSMDGINEMCMWKIQKFLDKEVKEDLQTHKNKVNAMKELNEKRRNPIGSQPMVADKTRPKSKRQSQPTTGDAPPPKSVRRSGEK